MNRLFTKLITTLGKLSPTVRLCAMALIGLAALTGPVYGAEQKQHMLSPQELEQIEQELVEAAGTNEYFHLKELLAIPGINVNARHAIQGAPYFACTALIHSIHALEEYMPWTNYPETIDLLIKAGADVNLKDALGRTALMRSASRKGTKEVVRLLLEVPSVDVYLEDNLGRTALHSASIEENHATIKLIATHMETAELHRRKTAEQKEVETITGLDRDSAGIVREYVETSAVKKYREAQRSSAQKLNSTTRHAKK